jgi:hypothetical protein
MPQPVPPSHPIRSLFRTLTERTFSDRLSWPDTDVIGYVSDMLVDFAHVENMYRIRNARGHRVEEVAELLLEGDLLHRAGSPDREREVQKHIGDYTLFMAGLFPEYVRRLKTRRVLAPADAFLDYMHVGKHAYGVVAAHTAGDHAEAAPLFRKLSENFELCVYGLGHVRQDLDQLRHPAFRPLYGMLQA